MNSHWNTFLLSQQATIDEQGWVTFHHTKDLKKSRIYPLTHLGVLLVSGQDAAQLLQGQITFNVNEISAANSGFAAMCNPKGKVIATFLIAKKGENFFLVLPLALVETVLKRLQMYILRSKVSIRDATEDHCLIGLDGESRHIDNNTQYEITTVNLPAVPHRKLLIANVEMAMTWWKDQLKTEEYSAGDTGHWRLLDIKAGIPWILPETSEAYIPQMLNLDKLGGVSFNKGCYTGQEIVARTHYLGKAKRGMVLAECTVTELPLSNVEIFLAEEVSESPVGHVLMAQLDHDNCKLLVVLAIDSQSGIAKGLKLHNTAQTTISLLPFSYDESPSR